MLLVLIWLSERALNSPWGRMMRAIRDNEVSAAAMGKDVTRRHLQIFIIGSAVVGLAGAMLTSMEGQLTPSNYSPLRFTFLIWVMVIVGGSGNNWGSVLGGLLLGWLWLIVENAGPVFMGIITQLSPWIAVPMATGCPLRPNGNGQREAAQSRILSTFRAILSLKMWPGILKTARIGLRPWPPKIQTPFVFMT